MMENWAIAAPEKHPFIVAWKDEFEKAITMGFRKYKRKLDRSYIADDLYDYLPYLTQHAAWCVVYAKDAT